MVTVSTAAGRANQKARTRAALLQAATELVRDGRPPSIPEVADRALISVATAYRYFPSAEELWFEASTTAVAFEPALVEVNAWWDLPRLLDAIVEASRKGKPFDAPVLSLVLDVAEQRADTRARAQWIRECARIADGLVSLRV